MHLTKESEYALVSLAYLAAKPPGVVVPLTDIARANSLPPAFLAKTLRKLVVHGLVTSHRGRQRGYRLGREPERITVRDILEGTEGSDLFARCVFWGNGCSDRRPCALHPLWASLCPQVAARLEETTLAALVAGQVQDVPVITGDGSVSPSVSHQPRGGEPR
jgi:Rrf2 family protein